MPSGRRVLAVLTAVVIVAAGGAAGAVLLKDRGGDEQRRAAAQQFADAWRAGTLATLTYAGGTAAATVAADVAAATAGLTTAKADRPTSVTVTAVARDQDAATATLRVTWALGGNRSWSYDTTLPVRQDGGTWRPAWTPSAVQPSLTTGSRLVATRTAAARGNIVGTDGTVLVTQRDVVKVGIEPRRSADLPGTVASITALVDVDGAALLKRAQAAAPTSFVDVITLREDDYQPLRDRLQAIPGTVFTRTQLSLAPTAGFARALLGTVGPATADIVKASDGRVLAGDVTGISGIQRTYDATLGGTAGVTVEVVSPAGATGSATATPTATATASPSASSATAATRKTVYEVAAVAGTDLPITLQQAAQEAAEKALEQAKTPAGLVAIRVSTGEVIAVANGGPNASGYDRALLGQYPPGSTFKVASGLALLQDGGITPDTQVACPPSFTVSGKVFTNAEDEVLGDVPFSSDFAHSCNTAFVGSAPKITGEQLAATAAWLGYGEANTLGVQAFTGSVPVSDDAVEHAAAMIGQSKVLASPLAVAAASATIAKGSRIPLSLVKAPAGDAAADTASASASASATASATASASALASASASAAAPAAITASAAEAMRGLMRGVVTFGTGTALKDVPGDEVSGKTGTAEYGQEDPPRTHSWFTGFQGDIAFAAVVEDGGFGAETAAPICAAFLTELT